MVSRIERWAAGVGLLVALAGVVATRPSRAFAPLGRFTVSADSTTVVDTKTGLLWQAVTPQTLYTWSDATSYCHGLALGGSSSWRMPSVGELQTLIDDSRAGPAIDPIAFPSVPFDFAYWTSSSLVGAFGGRYDWTVSFQDGTSEFYFWTATLHVRCVTSSPSS
jgi:hypothetical protein